jgi:hypothetical protein
VKGILNVRVAESGIITLKLDVSVEEILVVGNVLCALIIAIGITSGDIPVAEGGAIIVSLCGGTVVIKVLKNWTKCGVDHAFLLPLKEIDEQKRSFGMALVSLREKGDYEFWLVTYGRY